MTELTSEQIEGLNAAPLDKIYEWFTSMFPPHAVKQLEFLLLRNMSPEKLFEMQSALTIPATIKDRTIAALYWRKGELERQATMN